MRDSYERLTDRGAAAATIGMGSRDDAAAFKAETALPFPLLVDRPKDTYRMAGLIRGSTSDVLGPKVWRRGVGAVARRGLRRPKQDYLQLGGTAVIGQGGELLMMRRAESSADNATVDEIVEALP